MKKKKRSKLAICIIFFAFIFSFFMYYKKFVHPIIFNYTKAKINALTEQAVNMAVSNVINQSLNYDSIIDLSYTSSGDIAFVHANQYVINSITREVVKNAQQNMATLGEDGVSVPIGSFTGISIFNGRGVPVKLQMVPVGIVSSNFESKFYSVGINNTLHRLYLDITAKVEIILPLNNTTITTKQSVLLCEGVIIGKVPEVYLGNKQLIENFDLTP